MSSTQTPTITDTVIYELVGHGATAENRWMTLTQLREVFEGFTDVTWTRASLDAALTELHATKQIRLIGESNQKTLTPADREAALWLGGEYRHLAQLAK